MNGNMSNAVAYVPCNGKKILKGKLQYSTIGIDSDSKYFSKFNKMYFR